MRERVTVRMTDDMISQLDAWIAAQPSYVSRQEVVRRCVELALKHPEVLSALACDTQNGPIPQQSRQS
jgi:Arc/MetJ-type ribon-helix-helix transcriptional regulator